MHLKSRPMSLSTAFFFFASAFIAERAEGFVSPMTTMPFFFIMPAFSQATCLRVSPRYSVWSRPMDVITETSGLKTFVASSLPPMPVSIIAISIFLSLKY